MPRHSHSHWHWGPGPVFVHESIAAARRWQSFALRSLFVFGLLVGLALAWLLGFDWRAYEGPLSIRQLAALGEYFYYAIASAQLLLVLLIAPAATADAICLDRARGNLTHMLVTDLTSPEIVLGKLAARLVPVLGLVAASIPVLALAGLLGGVVFEAIVTLTVVTLAVAVFGCCLAMALSVRAKKTHEVLMAVYAIELGWVLGPLIWSILHDAGGLPQIPSWCFEINPFVLAWAPYAYPDTLPVTFIGAVVCGILGLSAGLVVFAILRIRAEERNRSGERRAARWSTLSRRLRWLTAWSPRPSLDDNPVLWREWRRGRPSWIATLVWGLYVALALAGTCCGVVQILDNFSDGLSFLQLVNGLQATFALLLISLAAPTALAEERVRGSLDVLLASPLPTERIVTAKWWGAYRFVPALCILPAVGALCVALGSPGPDPQVLPRANASAPFTTLDRIAVATLPVVLLLAQGAVVTSLGLALATWFRRPGRALAVCVTSYVAFAFGYVILLEIGVIESLLTAVGLSDTMRGPADGSVEMILSSTCPLLAQYFTLDTVSWTVGQGRGAFYIGQVIVVLAMLAFALILLGVTQVTFDRCVGRVPERPRRAPRPPRRVMRAPGHRAWTKRVEPSSAVALEP